MGIELLLIIILILVVLVIRYKKKNSEYESKYSDIINIDEEKQKINQEIDKLKKDFRVKKEIYDNLVQEVAIYNNEIAMAELGFYKPIFDFDTSEQFKQEIKNVRTQQKGLISQKKAIYATTTWTIDGSKQKGSTMVNRATRLTARAFNNECDSAIAKIKWNNIEIMIKRIEKAFEAINKLNESNHIIISSEYLNLKLKELQLTYEYENKKQQEKEEQAEIRQQMREEAQLEKEIEKVKKEEEKYQKLLDRAQKDAQKATGKTLDTLNDKIKQLEMELQEAHEKNQRALSMAQQTKAGHVYVISNIGSFGEDVYKIGMTRRLEPLDRVKELGDASVPFIFDVHAMIYSNDAPSLENQLHKVFDQKRLNLVNSRKEFFNVTLDDIEKEVYKVFPNAEFIKTIEARQYKESLAIRKQNQEVNTMETLTNKFPDSLE